MLQNLVRYILSRTELPKEITEAIGFRKYSLELGPNKDSENTHGEEVIKK